MECHKGFESYSPEVQNEPMPQRPVVTVVVIVVGSDHVESPSRRRCQSATWVGIGRELGADRAGPATGEGVKADGGWRMAFAEQNENVKKWTSDSYRKTKTCQ